MELFLYYLLRVSVLMALFYGFYKLFLAGNTFHAVNRVLLVIIALTSSLLPLFRFNLLPERKAEPVTQMVPVDLFSIPITEMVESQPRMEIPWVQILMVLFVVGFLFALVRYFAGLVQLLTIIRKSEKQTIENHSVLCISDENTSPFSWMKYIVLARKDWRVDNQSVIRHENAHIHLQHSWDMLFFDLFTCIFWFNPFSWLLRREIQSVHEFQADEKVLLSGIDAKQYQLLLIRKSVGEYKFALANNFRQRDLQKRIIMMKKKNSNRTVKWNYAMSIPVVFLAMIALSVPKLNANVVGNEKVTLSGLVSDKNGVMPGTLVSIKGTNYGTVTDMDGRFTIEVEVGNTLVFSTINYKTADYKVESSDKNNLTIQLEPEEGEEKASVKVTAVPQNDARLKGNVIGINTDSLSFLTPAIRSSKTNKPLIIVDGTIVLDLGLQKIDPNDIESISVLKDKSAMRIYGEKGEHGVVLITTKNAEKKED